MVTASILMLPNLLYCAVIIRHSLNLYCFNGPGVSLTMPGRAHLLIHHSPLLPTRSHFLNPFPPRPLNSHLLLLTNTHYLLSQSPIAFYYPSSH